MQKVVKNIAELDPNGTYSYADYLAWLFKDRVELFRGKLTKMSPAPNTRHQAVSSAFLRTLFFQIKEGSPCSVFHAPFDVRLTDSKKATKKADSAIFTVVQPDICVVCDAEKLDEKGCVGAPDWIIEIISRGTARRDLKEKKRLYEENGVREYWIIHPSEEWVQVFSLDEKGQFGEEQIFENGEKIKPTIFSEMEVDLKKIFA